MKKMKLVLSLGLCATLISCSNVPSVIETTKDETTNTNEPSVIETTTNPTTEEITTINPYEGLPEFFSSNNIGYSKEFTSLAEYTPTTFQKSSFSIAEEKELSDGVKLIKYNYLLNSSKKVIAHTLNIDLKKADIKTTYSNTKDTVSGMVNSYERNTNKEVIAGINADYFGGAVSVNAFVSASKIIKNSHNDNGIYDYTNAGADIPASKPMLFGISGEVARIAPIVENKTIEETIKSKVKYQFTISNTNNEKRVINSLINLNFPRLRNGINLLNDDTAIKIFANSVAYKFEKVASPLLEVGKFISKEVIDSDMNFQNQDDNYFYVIETQGDTFTCNEGDYLTMNVSSDDSKWNYYTDIIGGRHSLIENGNIADTVSLEYQNGAANTGVPRSAVGLKDKNTVCIVAIEGLRYNSKLSVKDDDGYGVNLSELADFMRYISIYDAVNLDGGGSTQLVVNNSETNKKELLVRSSDYGVFDLTKCRPVYNSILITKK